MFVLLVPAFKFVTDLFGVGVNCWLVFSLLVQFVVVGLLVVWFVFGMGMYKFDWLPSLGVVCCIVDDTAGGLVGHAWVWSM